MKRLALLILMTIPVLVQADSLSTTQRDPDVCTSTVVTNSSNSYVAFSEIPGIPGKKFVVLMFDYGMAADVTGTSEVKVRLGDTTGYTHLFTERDPYAPQNVAQNTGGYTSPMVYTPWGLSFTAGAGLVMRIVSGTFSGGSLRASVCGYWK
jgi:hypothetical protein